MHALFEDVTTLKASLVGDQVGPEAVAGRSARVEREGDLVERREVGGVEAAHAPLRAALLGRDCASQDREEDAERETHRGRSVMDGTQKVEEEKRARIDRQRRHRGKATGLSDPRCVTHLASRSVLRHRHLRWPASGEHARSVRRDPVLDRAPRHRRHLESVTVASLDTRPRS